MGVDRILFASCHGYIDPTGGAARSTRERMERLAARGIDCRVLATGVMDYRRQTPLEPILDALGVPVRRARAALAGGGDAEVFDFELGGVRVATMPTASSLIGISPDQAESERWLDLAEQVLDRFRPQVVSTFGGHPAGLELMARARRRGIAVVFHLHNFGYVRASTFADASAVVVPSAFARDVYAERLGLACTVIPDVIERGRVVAADPEPRFLTFVNPVPAKGVTVFARIAAELGRRRPDIPLLVVEGRAGAVEDLAMVDLDLSGLTNLHRMANTPDPRAFYRVSRAVLVPSLWEETLARVAIEAMMNGLPVLASDRGGLPETLRDAGFLLPVPARCTPESMAVPTPEEVAPWVATIERLWDDPAWEAEQRAKALAASMRWDADRLAAEYEDFFARLVAADEPPTPRADAGDDWLTWVGPPEPLGGPPIEAPAPHPAASGEILPLRVPPPMPDPTLNFSVVIGGS